MKKFLDKITELFENKKKRYLMMLAFMAPFIIAIGVFGFIAFKEAKTLIKLNETVAVSDDYQIPSKEYVLRDNATDLQKELFAELKGLYEGTTEGTSTDIAVSVCKNYVADFYTWSNKYGQYDVGGTYYVFEPQRKNIYLQARDSFYKYLNEYINKYGAENLLEVETVTATGSKSFEEYISMNPDDAVQTSHEEAYDVKVNWTYKANEVFTPSRYVTSMEFKVINNEGRFEIVEAH